ncbi:histidine kinase [Streptomyces sp. NPDC052610]|uniref:sensor histidine kinase n=1 Tax=Streptomyces sp. NPDC052610 TaxID=3154952 RepID=UPI00343EAC1C
MIRLLRPLLRGTTYTRLLHLWVPMLLVAVWFFVDMERWWIPALALVPVAMIPAARRGEGLQARFMLLQDASDSGISTAPSATWGDRWRTVLWLQARLVLGSATAFTTVWMPVCAIDLIEASLGREQHDTPILQIDEPHWGYALLAPLPLIVMAAVVVALGELITVLARGLLGPSAAERLAALEERTERLLERNRIARELHDTIGHALTVAVVQAGAARAAGDPAFTDRALAAIEDTGRAALEDLDRVLGVLREAERPVSARPTLTEADRLLASARASGTKVDAEFAGPLATVPGPVSREGYRMLQEALTNVLRHGDGAAARVRVAVADGRLDLEVRNPLPASSPGPGRDSGLRGIRERAALLGGRAHTGPDDGDWQVRVELPLG